MNSASTSVSANPGRRSLPTRWIVFAAWLLSLPILLLVGGAESLYAILEGPDDHMRWLRVQALLDGADWYNDTLAQLNPPEGTVMIWARLPDLPVAGIVGALEPLIGRTHAAYLAVAGVPLLLLLPILAAVTRAARDLTVTAHAPAAALLLLTSPAIRQVLPGRIDHHNWVVLATALGLLVLTDARHRTVGTGAALLSGAALGVGLYVSLEALFAILPIQVGLAILWLAGWPNAARRALVWSGTMTLAALLLWPVSYAPWNLFTIACDRFSVVYVVAIAAMALFWTVLSAASKLLRTLGVRLMVASAVAAVGLGALWLTFPACRGGPMSQIPDAQWPIWLSYVSEMKPLWQHDPSTWVYTLGLPALALAYLLSRLARDPNQRPFWIALSGATILVTVLVFVVVRSYSIAHVFSAVAAAGLLSTLWQITERSSGRHRRAILGIGSSLAVFLAPVGAAIAIGSLRPDNGGIESTRCDPTTLPLALASLNEPPKLIAAPVFLGPYILTGSPHHALAGQYHRNVDGNAQLARIFGASTPVEAKRAVLSSNVDVIVLCPSDQGLPTGAFIAALREGETPAWLRQLPTREAGSYRIYAVTPSVDGRTRSKPAR